MKIFVLHYSKLTDRKRHILEQFKIHNITDYEFIEKYDKSELTENDKKLFEENYNTSMVSLMLKHFWVYSEISEKYDSALILEDDVLLADNFMDKLNNYINQLPEDFDMLFIGNGCNLHIESNVIIPNKNIYEKCLYPTHWGGDGGTRCTDSYIVSKKGAKQICEYLNNLNYKINQPSDWWLNRALRDTNCKVYWAEPTIVTQGTETGLFQSSHFWG
uniref:Glycosyl transferase family 25 domain-containing protein n=1 Tax=viral metagenome TaxID=1070528 RepID=A0A6C0EQH4_9ZZZZ